MLHYKHIINIHYILKYNLYLVYNIQYTNICYTHIICSTHKICIIHHNFLIWGFVNICYLARFQDSAFTHLFLAFGCVWGDLCKIHHGKLLLEPGVKGWRGEQVRWVTLHLGSLKSYSSCSLRSLFAVWGDQNPSSLPCCRAVFFNWGWFCPQGTLAMAGNIFGGHNLGRACYWHLVGGGLGCCSTPYKAQDGSRLQRMIGPQISILLW